MRVALYARRSKPPKGWLPSFPGEHAPGSLEAQLSKLRAWAEDGGHEIMLEEADTATGRNPNRPGWRKIMGAVKGRHVDLVLLTRTSRAMRNVRHYLDVVDQFIKRGVRMEVLEQPQASVGDRDDPMSRAFRTIAAAFNQLEVDLHREQSMEVLERRSDGRLYGPRSDKPAGRPTEYGPEHKFRTRNGRQVHDKPKCPICRGGETGGPPRQEKET